MSQDQLRELRAYFDNSLFAFAWTFFNFRDLLPRDAHPLGGVHGEICDLLALWGTAPEYNRLMIQVPRGSYKTSLCTLSNSLWQVSRADANITLLICNEVMDNSKKWLRAIREVVMGNKLYQTVYRDILPPGIHYEDTRALPRWWKWNDAELNFEGHPDGRPEANLTAAGVGSATTGGHWDRIIKDDLISEDAKNSDTVMQRVREWFDSTLPLERPPYKGVDLIVCTPWTYADVYRYILEKYSYRLYRRSVLEELDNEEISLLPHKWTVPELHSERERDPYYFSSQMMCHPRPGREQSFMPEWLRYFHIRGLDEPRAVIEPLCYHAQASEVLDFRGEIEPPPQEIPLHFCNKALLVDPAAASTTSKTADLARTAIVAEAIDPWGRRFILDCWADRANPEDVVKEIFRLAELWDIHRIGIEEVTFSVLFQHWIRQEAQRRGHYTTVIGLKPRARAKIDRIESKIPGFSRGFYYLNRLPQIRAFEREYLDYPYGQTRDLLDAVAYDDDLLRRPDSPDEIQHKLERVEEAPRTDITGYGSPYF
jgi:hypothetical protein